MCAKISLGALVAVVAVIGQHNPANAQVYYSNQYSVPVEGTYSYPGNQYQQPAPIPSTVVRIPWSQKLLSSVTTAHDFGSVPALSKQEHVFEFQNTTEQTLHLVDVKASCGCTKPRILTPSVAPGETAQVLAQFQTRTFRGEKKATVTVTVDRIGQYIERGELQFSVKGKIRKDVVMTPGEVNFASFSAADHAQQIIKMKYAGSPLWQILKIKSTNPYVHAEAVEISRQPSGKVAYEVVVKVDQAMPAGTFEEKLTVFTNDKNSPQMPITVAGRVKPTLEAAPIQLGIIKQGTKVEKRLVVRGDKPFSIRGLQINHPNVKFTLIDGEKSLHVIPYTLVTDTPETIREKMTILTSDPDNPEKVIDFTVRIVPDVVAVD